MNNQPARRQPEKEPDKRLEHEPGNGEELVAPGIPIVRGNTPRPRPFEQLISSTEPFQGEPSMETVTSFPFEAPAAPPVPEEYGESDGGRLESVDRTPLPSPTEAAEQASQEFLWLFEYGLEMDSAFLNSRERLDGLALLYGPAVLKGYEITFDALNAADGRVVATIVPSRERGAEVWGVLYRVHSRVLASSGNEPSLLDRVHSAGSPGGLFERLQVTVQEAYRNREISCITYIASATARNHYHLLPRDRQAVDNAYMQRLLEIAKKQKLPGNYLQALAAFSPPVRTAEDKPPLSVPEPRVEQNTEPLPVILDKEHLSPSTPAGQGSLPAPSSKGLIVFALYIVFSLLAILAFAPLQRLIPGSSLFSASFLPPDIPWFILVYGFMGGCLGCIISLARQRAAPPPNFILITWFARPFVGAVLSALAYLLLSSGLFVLSGSVQQHSTLFAFFALLAGACEGWLFYRK